MAEAKKSNISMGTWMILIGTALFFDALEAIISLIPILGQMIAMGIDAFAFATFWLIFKMNNESYSKKTFLGGFIIGFIPVLNILPECTISIVMLYLDAKAKNVLAKVPGGQIAAQTGVQGHVARNTTIVNGEMKNKSDMRNKNSKPVFDRFQNAPTNSQTPPSQKDPLEKEHTKIKEENERKYREGTKDPTQTYRDEMNKFYGRETPKENKPNVDGIMKKDENKRRIERNKEWSKGTQYRREFKGGEGLGEMPA